MGTEIERKFLVRSDSWRAGAPGARVRQGYLCLGADCTVRVRVGGGQAYLTVKGRGEGIVRPEYEYPIPVPDAEEMLDRLCRRPLVEKTRYRVEHRGHVWEIDEFHGENEGLVVAEIELRSESEAFDLPSWAGAEVSDDPRYLNASLVARPFRTW